MGVKRALATVEWEYVCGPCKEGVVKTDEEEEPLRVEGMSLG